MSVIGMAWLGSQGLVSCGLARQRKAGQGRAVAEGLASVGCVRVRTGWAVSEGKVWAGLGKAGLGGARCGGTWQFRRGQVRYGQVMFGSTRSVMAVMER